MMVNSKGLLLVKSLNKTAVRQIACISINTIRVGTLDFLFKCARVVSDIMSVIPRYLLEGWRLTTAVYAEPIAFLLAFLCSVFSLCIVLSKCL